MKEFPKSKGLIAYAIINLVLSALGILTTVIYTSIVTEFFNGLLILALIELAFAISMFVAIQSSGRKLFVALRIIAGASSTFAYFVLTITHLTIVMATTNITPDYFFSIAYSFGALSGFVFSLLHFIYSLKEIRSETRSTTYIVSCRGEILSTGFMFAVLLAQTLFNSIVRDLVFDFSALIVIGLLVSFLVLIAIVYNKQKAKA